MTSPLNATETCPGVRGACHGTTLQWMPTVVCLLAALHAVSVWIALDFNLQAVITFKRWSTVYFWSIIVTAWGIILYAVVIDLMFFTMVGDMHFLSSRLYPVAWIVTTTGFLLVLYSRLHLILDSPRLLRTLFFVILGIGVPLQIFMVVAGTGFPHHLGDKFIGFMRQSSGFATDAHMKLTFGLLILAEIFVVVGDVVIVTLWYKGLYLLRLALSPFLYAIKLKVEFMVLNHLTSIGKRKIELRNITVSVMGDEEVIQEQTPLPCTFDTALTLAREERNTSQKQNSAAGWSNTLPESIRDISTSVSGSGGREEKHSFDEMERRYLGRFSGTDRMV